MSVKMPSFTQKFMHANMSLALLKLHQLDKSVNHGERAVALAPTWGKAYARLGEAQRASGFLLEAADSFRLALSVADSFNGCKRVYENLLRSNRYRKLDLIRRASAEGPLQIKNRVGETIAYPGEENNAFNAVSAMNEQQKHVLRMIRMGRVLPEGEASERVKEQDLILYLAALDASILLHVPENDRDVMLCPGTRTWLIESARREMDGDVNAVTFDIYRKLLDLTDDSPETQKCWKHEERFDQDFSPNRECDNSEYWGPSVTIMVQKFFEDDRPSLMLVEATFLIGLNHFFLVRAGIQNSLLDLRSEGIGAFEWDRSQQRLLKKYPQSFRYAAEKVGSYFANFCPQTGHLRDVLWYKDY